MAFTTTLHECGVGNSAGQTSLTALDTGVRHGGALTGHVLCCCRSLKLEKPTLNVKRCAI